MSLVDNTYAARYDGLTVNTPQPHEGEHCFVFLARFQKHPTSVRLYPALSKRLQAAEESWAKAKRESLVSIDTSEGVYLLFGSL